jgi:hypothetical protein
MYKLLVLLKQTDDKDTLEAFSGKVKNYLSELSGKEIKTGEIEPDILSGSKYIKSYELETTSQETVQQLLQTKTGRELSAELLNFSSSIIPLFINY